RGGDPLTLRALYEIEECADGGLDLGGIRVDDCERANDLVFVARDGLLGRHDAVDADHLDALVTCGSRTGAGNPDRAGERVHSSQHRLDLGLLDHIPAVGGGRSSEDKGLEGLASRGVRLADVWPDHQLDATEVQQAGDIAGVYRAKDVTPVFRQRSGRVNQYRLAAEPDRA